MGNDIVVGLGSVDRSAGKGLENGLVTGARDRVGLGVGDGVGRVVGDGVGESNGV